MSPEAWAKQWGMTYDHRPGLTLRKAEEAIEELCQERSKLQANLRRTKQLLAFSVGVNLAYLVAVLASIWVGIL